MGPTSLLASVGVSLLLLLHGIPFSSATVGRNDEAETANHGQVEWAARREFYLQNDIILPQPRDSSSSVVDLKHPRSLVDESGDASSNPLQIFIQFANNSLQYIRRQLQKFFGCPAPADPAVPLPGKKGVGLTLRDEGQPGSWVENLPKVLALNVSWNYSWNRVRIPQQPDDIEFVPMIWGANEENIQTRIADVVPDFQAGLTHRFLAFNEPDNTHQASMSVESAVNLWHYLEETGMPLASPATLHVERDWMVEFMEIVQNSCMQMNYIAVHWYRGPNAQRFKDEMENAYAEYGGKWPLLITEFAPADWTTGGDPSRNRYTERMVLEFAKEVIPWLERQDFIAGYSWFSFKQTRPEGHTSALFDLNGQLTPLGQFYASVTPDNPSGNQSIVV